MIWFIKNIARKTLNFNNVRTMIQEKDKKKLQTRTIKKIT